jgi:hypothetical protein
LWFKNAIYTISVTSKKKGKYCINSHFELNHHFSIIVWSTKYSEIGITRDDGVLQIRGTLHLDLGPRKTQKLCYPSGGQLKIGP